MVDIPITNFNVVNLGCKVNRVESDAVQAALRAAGGTLSSQEQADLIVVNTCTVTGEADKKARKAVRHALSCNPQALVVVTGCAVAIDEGAYAALGPNVRVVQRAELMTHMAELAKGRALRMGDGFRTRVNVKVQDGCDHACTYCIVHVARGKATSVPFESIVRDVRGYLEHGAKEIVLAGIDLASYRDGDVRLAQLIGVLLEEADKACEPGGIPARVRASSIEPHTLDEALVD
ncbi:MAG: radical SAM protein, partial [Eggerthellaceae bacterium]|nr:radical SAM protein [Eggerthellaceae bacterium]